VRREARRRARPSSTTKQASLPALKRQIAKALQADPSARVVPLLRQAAALDDTYALEYLALLFREGLEDRQGRIIVKRNKKASIRYYRRAAELGSGGAMDALASTLSEDWVRRPKRPTLPELAEVIGWYRKAINLGGDCYNLAVTYQNLGWHKKAVHWFRKCAATGNMSAVLALAQAELYGVGLRRNVPAALAKLRTVASAKEEVSQFQQEEAMRTIAQVLYDGWLVRRDYNGVLMWLRRAAKAGSAASQGLLRDLGESDSFGQGTNRPERSRK
jgi:TPR repeat protein